MTDAADMALPGEVELVREMIGILERKLARDYPAGSTLRAAHPKSLGVLHGSLTVEEHLPAELAVGVFQPGRRYDCWLRSSSASAKPQSDAVPDLRGLAIKLLGATGAGDADVPRGQDFVLLSHPSMPLGTVPLFRDAIYYAVESSPLLLLAKFVLTGHARALWELKKASGCPTSPLDIRYWSTTPYRFGDRVVKYGLIPTSAHRSTLPAKLGEHYLTDAMAAHLDEHEATFDFCVQLQKDGMPIEDAAVVWDEAASPFIKLATVVIPLQVFRTPERRALSESLAFSPGHALPEHSPLGGLNRARVAIYERLARFRRERDAVTGSAAA
ncbi:MAG: hypothetical protein IPI43_17305 [Sandaracinaceae bacterium]|jgi:hypothetical protein|nr:hypothetical protein [Sandaracinaceae bacterium]MBK7775864.1 hypothetical protein [Sandaracinaceae bacterium]